VTTVITVVAVVCRCRHRHEQAGAVDGNNFSKLYICVFLFEGIYPKGGVITGLCLQLQMFHRL